ncbi:MAG: hypothetical protein M3525_08365 [Acidobacteriota bacterium]|nr:hypothetical protein [Acidobacteriota bacterium]
MPKLRTKIQNSKMFGLMSKCGLTHDDLRDYAAEVSNGRTEHTSELYISEADKIIHRLEAVAEPKEVSTRTVQYRRQKTGVKQIAQPSHLDLMESLARGRGITVDGLESLCRRTLNGNPRPRTTSETNKIIEALKAMNKRDAVFGAFKKQEAA